MSRCCFLDMNAFFASVEQQERPALRGKPVIVSPIATTDTTCALAASYEAKAFGIKTGMGVREARLLCPELQVVEARPKLYVQYHHEILDVLMGRFVEINPLSVDEMACWIGRLDASAEGEVQLAKRIKADFARRLGECMRCSIGLAPNVFLAKVAAEMQKPDGLTVLNKDNLPHALFRLGLEDLPGIAKPMGARLRRHGIRTIRQLYAADQKTLHRAWGSVLGVRWWYMLRGNKELDYGSYYTGDVQKSVGHSHVLPPEFRSCEGAKSILIRLFSKCMKRLRAYRLAASRVEVWVQFRHDDSMEKAVWKQYSSKHLHRNDDQGWLRVVRPLVERLSGMEVGWKPIAVGMVFGDLLLEDDRTLNLFEDMEATQRLSQTVDRLNAKREGSVEPASVFWMLQQAPFRIAFGKPD